MEVFEERNMIEVHCRLTEKGYVFHEPSTPDKVVGSVSNDFPEKGLVVSPYTVRRIVKVLTGKTMEGILQEGIRVTYADGTEAMSIQPE